MTPTQLRPGDCLIYRPSNWIGWFIAIKTWNRRASHVEMAVRAGKTIASRQSGVNYYDTRWDHLTMVVRPPKGFNITTALDWFDDEACGQSYDYLGLMRYFVIPGLKQSTTKQTCSELLTRVYRRGGVDVFSGQDADLVPPAYFATMAVGYGFTKVWDETDRA